MSRENLWFDFNAEEIVNPKTLLNEQAVFLREKSEGRLTAHIQHLNLKDGEILNHFNIVAPRLANYRFNLFSLKYSIPPYPLVFIYETIETEIANEEALLQKISEIIFLKETKDKLNSLYSAE